MENHTAPIVSSDWLASYWNDHPRMQDEDPFQYNKRLMKQVIELLEQNMLKLSAEY